MSERSSSTRPSMISKKGLGALAHKQKAKKSSWIKKSAKKFEK